VIVRAGWLWVTATDDTSKGGGEVREGEKGRLGGLGSLLAWQTVGRCFKPRTIFDFLWGGPKNEKGRLERKVPPARGGGESFPDVSHSAEKTIKRKKSRKSFFKKEGCGGRGKISRR